MTPAWARRAVFEPMWSAVTGASLVANWRALERSQYASETVLRERQEVLLRRITAIACRETPFYKRRFAEAGLDGGVRTFDDLRRLPVLTKAEIRLAGDDLLSRTADRASLLEFRTGGSTGVPLRLLISEEISHQRNAAARRSDLWTGWKVGEGVGAVWGNPKLPNTVKERLRAELLNPVIYLDTMALSPDSVRGFARDWRRQRPTLLFGHAHSIYLLARTARDLGIDDIRPKGILSTSMMLPPHERRAIEDVFGVKVTDRYGCEEVGLIGCECERHEGLHMNVDHVYTEFLRADGTPASPGERAFVVVTDLINDVMPFIRYRVEDLSARLDVACGCGRGLPMMDRVSGRVADFLVKADGVRVAGISLIENTVTNFAGIEQMQIVQEELDRIVLKLVPTPRAAAPAAPALRQYFETTFPGAKIDIELVGRIPQEANGKYRFAICRVPQ
jgi:phenylacetate-CoA ligase